MIRASRQTFPDTPTASPRASHAHATLAFYTAGRLAIEAQGAWRVREGDLLLLPGGTQHRVTEARRAELWRLSFAPGAAPSELLGAFERVRSGGSPIVGVPGTRHEYLRALFRELERVGQASGEAHALVERSLLTLILAETTRPSTAAPRGTRRGVVAEALRFIEQNSLRPLRLRDVAAAVGRSPAYVTTALTRATGRSAVQWIVAHRLAEAERLLLRSDERIEVIAERVGYADPTHFIRMFRRKHAMTPAAWRAARPNEMHAD